MPAFALSPTESIILLFLWLSWACLLFGGFLFGKESPNHARRMPAWTRMGSSLALVLAGWSQWLITQGTPINTLMLFLALGMTLGFTGDLFMAEWLSAPNRVLGGIGAFGIGHVLYIIGLLWASNTFSLNDASPFIIAILIWWIVASVLWYRIVYANSDKSFLHKVALPYALLLATTTAIATALALQSPAFSFVAIGAFLFLISDLILAAEIFNNTRFRWIGDVVWLTYGPGQMLIIFSLFFSPFFPAA